MPRERIDERVGEPIAVRRYAVEDQPDREIVLIIGKPLAPRKPHGDWRCAVLIVGIGDGVFHVQEGVDAVQALQLAQAFAKQALEASGLPITWNGGEPGALGLYCPISSPHGLWFQRLAEQAFNLAVEAVGHILVEAKRQGSEVRERTGRARSRARSRHK
ncbi:hypothetical protein WMF31_15115 [Sorangium sp. So ce1036]|uniref:DUF6968 family protein n=1 Tax=Sorangium sp. So ce1036 TaxID=3133328 RepID=UPI003F0E7715